MSRLIILFLLVSTLLVGQDRPKIVSIQRVETEKEVPSDGRHHSPLFVQMPQGPLRAYSLRTLHGITEEVVQTSNDDGNTWSLPTTAFQLPAGFGDVGAPKLLLDNNGHIHFFLPVNPRTTLGDYHQQQWNLWHVRSIDDSHWTPPKEIWKGYVGSLQSAIQLRSGRIVVPFCFLTERRWSNRGSGPEAFTYMGEFSSTTLHSDDGGESWTASPDELKTPAPTISTLGAIEPVLLELKDGRVWMLIRTQMGRFYQSFSQDGFRWSAPQPSDITSSDSPAGLLRLKNGNILLIWNHCIDFPYAFGGRHVLHAAISEDDGHSWRGFREILYDPARNEPPLPNGDFGVSYSLPALLSDGKVIFGFGYYRIIPAALLDPDWLYATEQHTDFSRGLDDWSIFGVRGADLEPGPDGATVLHLLKSDQHWPSGAVWNFPGGKKGYLRLKLLRKPGSGDVQFGLTDSFSTPFDNEDQYHNVFTFRLDSSGKFSSAKPIPGEDLRDLAIDANRWHSVELAWDMTKRECRISVDGTRAGTLVAARNSDPINYLRLRMIEPRTAEGILLQRVDADVSASWR
jgi:hypothetical protein